MPGMVAAGLALPRVRAVVLAGASDFLRRVRLAGALASGLLEASAPLVLADVDAPWLGGVADAASAVAAWLSRAARVGSGLRAGTDVPLLLLLRRGVTGVQVALPVSASLSEAAARHSRYRRCAVGARGELLCCGAGPPGAVSKAARCN